MRPKGSAKSLEARRQCAAKLLAKGHGIREVARRIGAAPSSVKRWKDALEDGGVAALRAKTHAGRPPLLSDKQKEQLMKILHRGPKKFGYIASTWTCRAVGDVIWQQFGVSYHPDHISRILRNLGWRFQFVKKPTTRRRGRKASGRGWAS